MRFIKIAFWFYFISIISCEIKLDCSKKEKEFKLKDLSKLPKEVSFFNESKHSIKMDWLGQNSKKILLLSTEPRNSWFKTSITSSDVYYSDDDGKSFSKITSKLDEKVFIQSEFGFNKNPHNPQHIILIGYDQSLSTQSSLFITTDGAQKWTKIGLSFTPGGALLFHPNNKLKNYILVVDVTQALYLSKDDGFTWTLIQNDVKESGWSSLEMDNSSSIFILKNEKSSISNPFFDQFMDMILQRLPMFTLQKSVNFGETWLTLQEHVYSVIVKNKYLYASIVDENKDFERHMRVSIDAGKTFHHVQLPTITKDRFYSVLDVEEDLVFLHVDDPDNGHGRGTLYTSDSSGIFFSESLRNHLYMTETGDASDFIRVNSMRGTYITTRIRPDNSLQTLISFNRGAEWQPIPQPEGSDCKDNLCELQIVNKYSKTAAVIGSAPLSVKNAPGLILAHGHVATNLKTTTPDVFVSSDGGYRWRKTLDGPHHYEIADNGGLIVAVPADDDTPDVIKFSTDEGRCWHDVKYFFSNNSTKQHFSSILTEPGSKSMTVALWSYGVDKNSWLVHFLDFEQILNKCIDSDYEEWHPHGSVIHPLGDQFTGCLLGVKETYKRLKPNSLCSNGHSYEVNSTQTYCQCTVDDYECEYGYYRAENSRNCTRSPLVGELDVCVDGNRERIITHGYRLIPGDKCQGGFLVDKTKQQMLNKNCDNDESLVNLPTISIKTTTTAIPTKQSTDNYKFPNANKMVQTTDDENVINNNKNRGIIIFFSFITIMLALCLALALTFIIRRRHTLLIASSTHSQSSDPHLHYHLLPNGEIVPGDAALINPQTNSYVHLVNENDDVGLVDDAHLPFSDGYGGVAFPGQRDPPLLRLDVDVTDHVRDDDDEPLIQ